MDYEINTRAMDNALKFWRGEVKGDQRGIYDYSDRISIKIKNIKKRIYRKILRCDKWLKRECYYTDIGKFKFIDKDWKSAKVGDSWGGKDVSCFFKQTVKIPDSFKGFKVRFLLYLGGDSLVKLNGEPYQGMDPFRNEILLHDKSKGGEIYDMEIESYHVWHFGEPEKKVIECSDLAAVDTEIEEIFWDFMTVYNTLFIKDKNAEYEFYVKSTLDEAVKHIRPDIPDRNEFLNELKKGRKILQKRMLKTKKYQSDGLLNIFGHSHLDVVFLWQYKEFVRKIGRTNSTMLRLMEEYPDFIFSQNQVIIYKELKEKYPVLYKQIKQRVDEGRWEILGPLWVEPDFNLISGESIVRQIMHGANFLNREFGFIPKIIWHPDIFGACYTIPQILKKAGMEFFVTHKFGVWNDTNPWKLNKFFWEGPDGSKIFTVTPPIHFIGTMEADNLSKCINSLKNNTGENETLYCYGWGDGGGGVNAEMLEYAKRYKKFPGLPQTKSIKAADALKNILEKDKNHTVWKDELYLEAHRGVYTTKGRLKDFNRKLENRLRETELLLSVCSMKNVLDYPDNELHDAWEVLLTNQFHDSVTGTHIEAAYRDIIKEYTGLTETVEKLRRKALLNICSRIKTIRNKHRIVIFNSLPQKSSVLACADFTLEKGAVITDENNEIVVSQGITDIKGRKRTLFYTENIPACGYKVLYLEKNKKVLKRKNLRKTISNNYFENTFFKVRFSMTGEIISMFDKTNKYEVLKEKGTGNRFRIYEDMPSSYEAWDISKHYKENELPLAGGRLRVYEDGPVCTSFLLEKRIFASSLKQKIIFYNDIARIDFETEIDWKERRKLLRVGFDINVMAKDYTCDIPFGNIKRPAYRNNSYEQAKFEVCAHNWIDLSEESYGVALFTDCKYGFDVEQNVMNITLLKSPVYPDPQSDMEKTSFRYAIFPHEGSWREAEVNQKALEFNNPVTIIRNTKSDKYEELPGNLSFCEIDMKNVTLEAFKKSENDHSYIVRVVERYGKRVNACLRVFKNINNVFECDLLENNLVQLKPEKNELVFQIKPYEIKTFKLYF